MSIDSRTDISERNSASANPFKELLKRLPAEFEPPAPDSPRGRIIGAARQLFADEGFTATSIRSIADRAEVNLAMVHYYYGSKEALYRRVMMDGLIDAFRKVSESMPPDVQLEDIVLNLPVAMATIMRNNPIWAQLIRREIAEGGPNIKLIFEDLGEFGPPALKEQLFRGYRTGVKSGRYKDLKPEAVMPLLVALGYGVVILDPIIRVVTGSNIDDEEVWGDRMKALKTIITGGLLLNNGGES